MSRRMRRAVAVLAAALLPVGVLTVHAPVAGAAAPTVVYVDPAHGGSDHDGCAGSANACATIGYALGMVAPGGTVIVESAVYAESPLITQAVTLVGHDATIDSLTVGDATASVDVSGFTISSALTPLVAIGDNASGADIAIHDNTLTGTTDPQIAVAVSANAADVAITDNSISATTSGVDLTGNAQPATYTITGNTFAITQGTDAAIALDAPGDSDVLDATVAGNSGTISPAGSTITRSGTGTITVRPGAGPNRLHAPGTSISVPDAPTTLTTLEDPTPFTATVTSGSSLSDPALDVVVSVPSGTSADELALDYTLDDGTAYTQVPLTGSGTLHAVVTDLSGLAPGTPAVIHFRLAALDGATAGPLSVALDLDELAADRSVINTAAATPLAMTATVNSVPVASPQPAVTVARNGSTDITLDATLTDDDPITSWTHSPASHGTLIAQSDAQHLRYTPAVGYSGSDSFTFTATDRAGTSQPAEVDITVSADNAPQANDLLVAQRIDHGASNIPIDLSTVVSDADSDALTYSIVTGAAHGTASVDPSSGMAHYAPTAAFGGTDSFTYRVNDGSQDSRTATVTVTVDSVPVIAALNTQPVPHNRTGQANNVPVTLSASDADQDTLLWGPNAPSAAHGTVTRSGSTFTYTPAVGYVGPDDFTASADDQHGGVTSYRVAVDVTDTAPTLTPPAQAVRVDYDASSATSIALACADTDGDDSHIVSPIASGPASGTITAVQGCSVSYRPTAGATGPDAFTVDSTDGYLTSAPVTVHVVIDTPPTAIPPQTGQVALGRSTTLQLASTDADHDALSYTVGRPTHGSVKRTGAQVTYTAPTDWAGPATFSFTANDQHGGTATGTATVIVARAPASLSLSVSPQHPTTAQHPTLTVHVTSAGNPNGLVVVGDQKVRARRGVATFSLPTYSGGAHTVSAAFNGTLTAAPVTKSSARFTVTKVASSLAVTTNPLQLTTKTTNATATVRIAAGSLKADSGVVTIDENGRRLASGAVRSGSVTVHLPRFSLGQHNLTVGYTGTDSIAPSSVLKIERVSLGP